MYVPALVGAGDEKVVAGGVVRAVPYLLKLNQPKVCGICVGAVLSWPREDWRHLPEHLAGDICGGSKKTIIEQKMGIE